MYLNSGQTRSTIYAIIHTHGSQWIFIILLWNKLRKKDKEWRYKWWAQDPRDIKDESIWIIVTTILIYQQKVNRVIDFELTSIIIIHLLFTIYVVIESKWTILIDSNSASVTLPLLLLVNKNLSCMTILKYGLSINATCLLIFG